MKHDTELQDAVIREKIAGLSVEVSFRRRFQEAARKAIREAEVVRAQSPLVFEQGGIYAVSDHEREYDLAGAAWEEYLRRLGGEETEPTPPPKPVKKSPGRPRKNPVKETASKPKRGPGRPRKNPAPVKETARERQDRKDREARDRIAAEDGRRLPTAEEQACGEKPGTTAGYHRHQRARQPACDDCRTAMTKYKAERTKKNGG